MLKILVKKQLGEIFRSYTYDAKKNRARSKAATVGFIVFFAVSVAIWIFEPNITRLFDSIWYCFSVATTIGLGDVLATTLVGRVLSIFLSICSILIIAVVPGVITSYYVESTKLRADESSAKFLDDLEHLPELSKEELVELSEKVKKFNRKK